MSDYIKDLNIIDFLGITVPGCLLVLLISGDNPSLLLWASYFGADAGPAIRGIFLAIAGYVIGMILHEIGDLAEKGTWCFTFLDPKAYAIRDIGISQIDHAAQIAFGPKDNTAAVAALRLRGILGCGLMLTILTSCILGFPAAMDAALTQETATHPMGWQPYMVSCAFLVVIAAAIIILAACLRNSSRKSDKKTKAEEEKKNGEPKDSQRKENLTFDMDTLKKLCRLNPQIQTYLVEKCTPQKLNMFDSFRHVMRNSLIAISIVNWFSIWHPVDLYRDVALYFSEAEKICHDISMLTFWFCVAVVFAFSRYGHFAYLRYKYGYEAFVSKVMSGDEPEVSNYHVVLVQKNSIQEENEPDATPEHTLQR